MIAKFVVTHTTVPCEGAEQVFFSAVSDKPYDSEGRSEDSDFARWTPAGELSITIANPNLIGRFKGGQKFYLNFTEADVATAPPTDGADFAAAAAISDVPATTG